MAPKNLLKQVFRNIIHQKSLEAMQLPLKKEQSGVQPTFKTDNRPQTEPLARTSSWVEEQAGLEAIDDASDSSGVSTVASGTEKVRLFDRFYVYPANVKEGHSFAFPNLRIRGELRPCSSLVRNDDRFPHRHHRDRAHSASSFGEAQSARGTTEGRDLGKEGMV